MDIKIQVLHKTLLPQSAHVNDKGCDCFICALQDNLYLFTINSYPVENIGKSSKNCGH